MKLLIRIPKERMETLATMHLVYIGVISMLLASTVLASPALPYKLAIRVDQSPVKRADFAGGWPLGANTCPSGTTQCNKNFASQVNPACCPSGTTCFGQMINPYCCPTSKNPPLYAEF